MPIRRFCFHAKQKTPALRTANELEVDIESADGTGPNGRITIGDVREAQDLADS